MNFELYNIVRKAEKNLKEKYSLKNFGIYIPNIEMESFSPVFQENESNAAMAQILINDFIDILKTEGYLYQLDAEGPNPLEIADIDENGHVVRKAMYYTIVRVKS